jgi:protein TonB
VGPVWRVAWAITRGEPVLDDILSSIDAAPGASGSEDAFAREMLARALNKHESTTNWVAALREHQWHVPEGLRAWLTKEEFAALNQDASLGKQPTTFRATRVPRAAPDTPRERSLSTLPAGLLPELMKLNGCTTQGLLEKSSAQVMYDEGGRPNRISVSAAQQSPACETAMNTAARLMIARDAEQRPEKAVDVVYFAIDPEMQTCAATAPLAPIAWRQNLHDARLTPASVRREVKPDYPVSARKRGVEGTPWIRAIVSPQGCVSEADVLRRLDPELDFEALRAVSRWRFTPAQREGEAVAVEVVIEVSFSMKR